MCRVESRRGTMKQMWKIFARLRTYVYHDLQITISSCLVLLLLLPY